MGVRKANNQGLVTTTAPGPDLCHTMPTANPTTVKIRKIVWYQNTGVQQTLQFHTMNNVVPAGAVNILPAMNCVNGIDGGRIEEELPEVELAIDRRAGIAGRTGDIWVQGSAAGIQVTLEVEEFREGS